MLRRIPKDLAGNINQIDLWRTIGLDLQVQAPAPRLIVEVQQRLAINESKGGASPGAFLKKETNAIAKLAETSAHDAIVADNLEVARPNGVGNGLLRLGAENERSNETYRRDEAAAFEYLVLVFEGGNSLFEGGRHE